MYRARIDRMVDRRESDWEIFTTTAKYYVILFLLNGPPADDTLKYLAVLDKVCSSLWTSYNSLGNRFHARDR